MSRAIAAVLAAALMGAASSRGVGAAQQTCTEAYGTCIPTSPIIVGQLAVDDLLLWLNVWGMRGYENDNFQQCLFIDWNVHPHFADELGWTWTKGTTDPVCCASGGQACPAPACMYQFSFSSLHYGIAPWGTDTGAADMPVNVGDLHSLVVVHDITYEATDDAPGVPSDTYARHALIYDLFLTAEKPAAGQDVSASITDEVIIMMNHNPEYPDQEACSTSTSDPIEANAVFDGFYHYDYHSFGDDNVIGQNYHQFRRVGGGVPGAPVPENLDVAPFLRYLKLRHNQPDLWLGQVTMGTQLYDHTHGSVTFHSPPTFSPRSIVLVESTKLAMKDDSVEPVSLKKRKLNFVSSSKRLLPEHWIVPPEAGGAGDPTLYGALLRVYNSDGGSDRASIPLLAADWSRTGTGWVYRGPDRINGPVRSVKVATHRLIVKGGRSLWPYSLDEASQSRISVRLSLGTEVEWCAETTAKITGTPPSTGRTDRVDRFLGAKSVAPPQSCPALHRDLE